MMREKKDVKRRGGLVLPPRGNIFYFSHKMGKAAAFSLSTWRLKAWKRK